MKLHVEHLRLNKGGYTSGRYGRYFGANQPGEKLFHVYTDDYTISEYVRAPNAKAAREGVIAHKRLY